MFRNGSRADRGRLPGPTFSALGLLLLGYYLVPLLAFVLLRWDGAMLARLQRPVVVRAAITSVATATTTTAVALVLGVPLAYWLARADVRGESVVTTLVAVPLVFPPIVSGMLLLTVFGGTTGSLVGIPVTRSFLGIVLAQLFVASPFTVIAAKATFEGIDPSLEESARTLGKGPVATFRSVTLPLAKGGIAAGASLTFGRAIGEFGATLMLAYYPRTLPVQIWVAFTALGLDAAFPIAAVLAVVSLLILFLINWLGTEPW